MIMHFINLLLLLVHTHTHTWSCIYCKKWASHCVYIMHAATHDTFMAPAYLFIFLRLPPHMCWSSCNFYQSFSIVKMVKVLLKLKQCKNVGKKDERQKKNEIQMNVNRMQKIESFDEMKLFGLFWTFFLVVFSLSLSLSLRYHY